MLQASLFDHLLLACPMKWLLHVELPQQHWVDYESIRSCKLGYHTLLVPTKQHFARVIYIMLVKQCHAACLNTPEITSSHCSTILHAHVCCMPLCFSCCQLLCLTFFLNIALPVCPCSCALHGYPPGFFSRATAAAAAGESCMCLQGCQTSVAYRCTDSR
jgi:hypothetical protein